MNGSKMESRMDDYRHLLKAECWDEWETLDTDRKKQIPPPLIQKPPEGSVYVDLTLLEDITFGEMTLKEAIGRRKSRRNFTSKSLTLEELSFLLWATQGIRNVSRGGTVTRRTVPSGGSRHPFETYLCVNRVRRLEPGLYRYLPLNHKLCLLKADHDLSRKIVEACRGQTFVGKGAVVFIWTTIPYRSEWRYGFVAHKMIAMEAGHVCQNLYLACEAIGTGTCAIGDYRNDQMDAIIGVDGEDEFVVYLAPVGKTK